MTTGGPEYRMLDAQPLPTLLEKRRPDRSFRAARENEVKIIRFFPDIA